MSNDLWRELAQVNRDKQSEERERLGERWDRLSSGELSPEEEAELRALAETSEEAREAYEAFRPLGPDFHASVVQAIREQALTPKPPARLLPFPRRAAPLIKWSTAAAAVAAAVLVGVLLRPPATLPDYASLEVSGASAVRGEGVEEVFIPGGPLKVLLLPRTAASRAHRLKARSFLASGEDLIPLTTGRPDSRGTVKMEGEIPDVPPGTYTLWLVVGRRGKPSEPADLLSAKGPVRQRDWVAIPQEILIKPREGLPP